MAKVRNLSTEERVKVTVLHEEGYSSRQIANKLKCNQSTVIRLIKKKQITDQVVDKARSGRPRKSSSRDDRVLRRLSLTNRKLTSPQLAHQWMESCSAHVSPSTVRRRCLEFGLKGCRARRKPLVTADQRKRRVAWARAHKDWTIQQWEKVLFSDESTFCILGDHSKTFVRRFQGEAFKPMCLELTVKHPTKIMVWGCMAANGMGQFKIIEGMMNADKYITTLQNVMLPSARDLFQADFLFQDDNAPCHRARKVMNWMEETKIQRLDWPAQSPDLNPIEYLWHILSKRVAEHNPRTKRQLIEALIAAWHHLVQPQQLQRLVHSMPARCRLVIKHKGWPTRY